jgi:hypothetical protein
MPDFHCAASYTDVMDDAELRDYVKSQIASETGLSPEWSQRLTGATLSELRADATHLAQTLGIAEPSARERDGNGPARGEGFTGRTVEPVEATG